MPTADQPRRSFAAPSGETVAAFLAGQEDRAVSYAEVGASRDDAVRPTGYEVDHNRVRLGTGEAAYAAARAALRAWTMFPAPWTKISPPRAPIGEGGVVAMQAHALGLWWLNACRIVYVMEDAIRPGNGVRRYGFAYGTLPAHVEQGEERFSVELHADGAVWYDLRAFSRPRYWPVRLAKPLARRLQRRFVEDSQDAMVAAVKGAA
jgi:uncharacterized protein (UPF0548 family)